ncbi:MAG: SDR family oxidoreductase [Chloroflexota bacterium]|nr:SDR family oxidoreductase [Chloroflexota bacterium]
MQQSVLVTGATGAVGREIVSRLLQDSDLEIYLLLHEQGLGRDRSTLLREVFSLSPSREYFQRIHLLRGDITRQSVGLSAGEHREVTRRVSHILHAAATTRFDLSLQEARHTNVLGTEQMIRLAECCEKLERFGFVSTAYVAGKRTGTICEEERSHVHGFANTYEQSKFEAEARLEEAHHRLPNAIYRFSTVLGDSRTGKVTHYTAPHHALRMMHLGLVAMLPGSSAYSVDLIPADFAAGVLCRLYMHHFKPGQVFHITAAERGTYTLEEIIEESYRYMAEFDPEWARRRYPKPVITSLEAFELFVRSADQVNNPIMQGVMRALRHFAQQLAYPKHFDRTVLLTCLADYDNRMPDVRSYYPKVVKYCLTTGWGKNA